ncbi:methyl-accepting chemotaxis protein [Ideonella sp. DXS29W]|uniref:Methyl-accepting chemotaxis protein n=1 Tax=Ideonella lacteola TaxID=2984193 RepID=A0ABU9BWW1_9BURK
MQSFFRNASINVKVSLAPALALLGLILVAGLGLYSNNRLAGELSAVGGEGTARIVAAENLALHLTDLHQRLYQSLTWEAVGVRPERIKALDDSLTKDLNAFVEETAKGAKEEAASDERREMADALAKGVKAYAKSAVDTIDMKSAGVANAASYVSTLDEQFKTNQTIVAKIVKHEVDSAQALVAQANDDVKTQARIVALTAIVTLVVCGAFAWALAQAITGPLAQAAKLAAALAAGDLTVRTADTGKDATGRVLAAVDDVAQSLTRMVSDIRSTAEQINTASGEIASGNADLSARTESAASAIQQAAASIEQLSTTIRHSADHAQGASKMATDAATVAREGGTLVSDVVTTMGAINNQARKIGDIIGTIDGIAFQTNILALNAAVEAARAGEQGRGFAVVAGEVRTLAQRSAEAAREIRALISSSVEQVESGVGKVESAGRTMERIVNSIEQVSQTVAEISRAAAEQASGISQVNQTVAEMDRNTQQNAAMVEQAAAATESLNTQAHNLMGLLTRFRTA